MTESGHRVTGPVTQLKGAWGWSSILVADTRTDRFYFKASYMKPPYEAVVVDELSKTRPELVPSPVVVDRKRNWMIMRDFGDTHLDSLDEEQWRGAVRTFAGLQRESIRRVEKWKGLNCPVTSPEEMAAACERLLRETEILHGGPDALGEREIDELAGLLPAIADRCGELSDSPVPPALHNEDFRSDNVAWGGDSFVFFDWSHTSITHPFFSMSYFLNRIKRPPDAASLPWKTELEDPERIALRDAYLEPWLDYGGHEKLCEDFLRVRRLFFLNEAIRCYLDLPYLETGTPWTINTMDYIPRCLRDLKTVFEMTGTP
jgi:hypothetical protein